MDFKIYLSGAMSGLSMKEQTAWRDDMRDDIITTGAFYDCQKKPIFFNPPYWYSFEECNKLDEKGQELYQKEAMNYDIYDLRNSNLVIVCLDHVNSSIGTAMEIAIAKELHIPIIGFFYNGLTELKNIHPWIVNSLDKYCEKYEDAYMYVVEYFLQNY
jgi:hypothetical protein